MKVYPVSKKDADGDYHSKRSKYESILVVYTLNSQLKYSEYMCFNIASYFQKT